VERIILFTGSQARKGGTERACADLANSLVKKGYEIKILSLYAGKESGYEIDNRVEVAELSASKLRGAVGLLVGSLKLYWALRSCRSSDILIVVESILFLYVVPIFLRIKRPRIINWEHFNARVDLGFKSRAIARKVASICSDQLVVLSERDRRTWKQKFKLKDDSVAHIPNINPVFVDQDLKDQSIILKKRPRVILAVGRLCYQKGFDLLLHAWASIPSEVRHGWSLRIVGKGPDAKSLERLAEKLNMKDEVVFAGYQKNILSEYANAQCFVLSSRFEGFGLVVLEALSCGTPVVSFDIVGPSELIRHEINGFLVDTIDAGKLGAALSSLMACPEKLQALSDNTSVDLFQFTPDTVVKAWEELFRSVTKT
jgi:glycosyltransferase involved in cell wall biosynthesis